MQVSQAVFINSVSLQGIASKKGPYFYLEKSILVTILPQGSYMSISLLFFLVETGMGKLQDKCHTGQG